MKKCPKCKQIFSEDYAFCLEDGTTLLSVTDEDSMPTVNVSGTEMETQVLPASSVDLAKQTSQDQLINQTNSSSIHSAETLVNPPVRPTIVSTGNSKWLYAILGAMAAIILVLGVSFYLTQNDSEGETANSTTTRSTFTPSGVWKGEWTSEKGGLSEAVMTLNDDGANQISGFITWTLRRSVNPNKKEKYGMKAIEYVQGTYDPLTRVISITGYEKKDPNDLIVLDSYKLTLAEHNNELRGSTRNQGKWSGNINLKRAE